MHIRTLLPAAAALLTLAACDQKTQVIDTRPPDPLAAEKKAAGPVTLPPAITASVSYRCADDSTASVDFFQGDTAVNYHAKPDDAPTHLTAPAPGKPFEGQGFKLSGDQKKIELTRPGTKPVTCKA